MTTLDLDIVRAQFPSFANPDTASWAHLENAGGSYCPVQVVDLVTDLFAHAKCQPRWGFGPSVAATEAMDRARLVMAELFNCREHEIHFGPSTSQNTYVLAKAMRPLWDEGDEIVVTDQDHEANQGAWRRLADSGITVKEWQVDPATGLLDESALDELISERTRLVAVCHASNIAATINPVRSIADRIHAVGGHIVVDGVSYAPHSAVDVAELDCDIYLYSMYKTYGPHVGLMYTRASVLEQMTNQGHYFKEGHPEGYLTPAGPDHAMIGAAAGVADYYDVVAAAHGIDAPVRLDRAKALFELFGEHEETLMAPVLDLLETKDDVTLVGARSADHSVRAPTISFHTTKRSSASVYEALIAARISCGHGNFYAHRLLGALGLDLDDGVVRLSAVHYNTAEEMARACQVLDEVL
jgi:cysteine desulfurase family protein (TIGR01976 family)